MLVRVTLAVLACFLLAAAPAGAAIPSSFPGAELVPIRGMAYQPTPSDYQPCGCGVYFRGDLRAMAEQLHVNFLHLYSWSALRDAFVGSTALAAVEAPPSGGGAADSSTVSSTGGATSSTEPPLSQATPPSNVFTLLRSRLAFNRRRTAATLTFVAPGPGKFAVRAAGAPSVRATSVRSHRRTIRRPVKPTTKRATAAGPVRVTVRLTRAAARILADRRRVRVRLRVTFTPDGGTAAVRRVNVTFRKRHR